MDQAQLKGIQKVLDPTTGNLLHSHPSRKFYPTKNLTPETFCLSSPQGSVFQSPGKWLEGRAVHNINLYFVI